MHRQPPDAAARAAWEARLAMAIRDIAGDMDVSGLELFHRIRRTGHLCEIMVEDRLRSEDLSDARWRLLFHLYLDEALGIAGGSSPTHLSHMERVSKNTISSLLRGLEAQGLIERTLDDDDRRSFRIRLSPSGRELMQRATPLHLSRLNDLAAALTQEEQRQLLRLLDKLAEGLFDRLRQAAGQESACDTTDDGRK